MCRDCEARIEFHEASIPDLITYGSWSEEQKRIARAGVREELEIQAWTVAEASELEELREHTCPSD